jgi:hypothetical protein
MIDSLRRRCEAAEAAARAAEASLPALVAENEIIARHLAGALCLIDQQARRMELLALGYGTLARDVRTLRGGHVNADPVRLAALERELVSNRSSAA